MLVGEAVGETTGRLEEMGLVESAGFFPTVAALTARSHTRKQRMNSTLVRYLLAKLRARGVQLVVERLKAYSWFRLVL